MVSITSFTDSYVEIEFSCWLSDFFLKLYLSPILPKKSLIVSILSNISLPDLIGWDAWYERVPIGNILLLLLLSQNLSVYFVLLVFWLGFIAAVLCAIVLKVGSSTLVGQSYSSHGFDLSNT